MAPKKTATPRHRRHELHKNSTERRGEERRGHDDTSSGAARRIYAYRVPTRRPPRSVPILAAPADSVAEVYPPSLAPRLRVSTLSHIPRSLLRFRSAARAAGEESWEGDRRSRPPSISVRIESNRIELKVFLIVSIFCNPHSPPRRLMRSCGVDWKSIRSWIGFFFLQLTPSSFSSDFFFDAWCSTNKL